MAKTEKTVARKQITIPAPNIQERVFAVEGLAPLVIHRFSHKTLIQMEHKMEAGSTAKKGKQREAANLEDIYNDARYISTEGWDGMNASAVRNSLISACRLVGFKMTLAKLSLFVVADGRDKFEPEISLIRIYGKPRMVKMRARVETGQPYVCIRPFYDNWKMNIRIRYDADQFTEVDVTNLLSRVGTQVGWGEGRPDSKDSAGMGWGVFKISDK